jgi:hypothetical protein
MGYENAIRLILNISIMNAVLRAMSLKPPQQAMSMEESQWKSYRILYPYP